VNKVTSTEFQKNIGRIQHQVLETQKAVVVTNHGREAFVLVPAKEYRRLKSRDRRAFFTRELPRSVVEAIGRVEMDPRHRHLDEELG
jgi:prevent-host-death family protein